MTKKEEKAEKLKEADELKEKVKQLEDQLKRTMADYQNLEKRTDREKSEWVKIANKNIIFRLLPVLDTLIMAQKHIKSEGFELSIGQFLDALRAEGVEKIEVLGKEFDPKVMECVGTIKDGEENKVAEEVMMGFTLFEEVLRPARVKVVKKESIRQVFDSEVAQTRGAQDESKEKKEEELTKEELQKGDYV